MRHPPHCLIVASPQVNDRPRSRCNCRFQHRTRRWTRSGFRPAAARRAKVATLWDCAPAFVLSSPCGGGRGALSARIRMRLLPGLINGGRCCPGSSSGETATKAFSCATGRPPMVRRTFQNGQSANVPTTRAMSRCVAAGDKAARDMHRAVPTTGVTSRRFGPGAMLALAAPLRGLHCRRGLHRRGGSDDSGSRL